MLHLCYLLLPMKFPIYMDNQATTPVDKRVLEAMWTYFSEDFGNAASRTHPMGWKAEEGVEKARTQVAGLIHGSSKEIIFTSGATESNNLAIKGAAHMYREKGNHIVTCVTEHKSVLDTFKALERGGFKVTYLPVDSKGLLDPEAVLKALTPQTILVSIMMANNEIGVIHPVAKIGRIAKENGIIFHTDAAQSVGKIEVDVEKMGIDLLSFSAHKIYGPKGVGALYVRRQNPRIRLVPLMDGGGHEQGLRSGTLNVPGIVGLGQACEIAQNEGVEESKRILGLREKLRKGIVSQVPDVYINGDLEKRLSHNLNLSFAYVEGESLLMAIRDEIAVSSGSACISANIEPSYVLKALGIREDLAHTSIRFGIGRFNTEEEVDFVVNRIVENVRKLRELSPLYEVAKQKNVV